MLAVGKWAGHLGQSIWLRECHGREDGPPPPVDLVTERRAGDFVRAQIEGGAITACHDVSDGGLAVAIAEMALAGDVGAIIQSHDTEQAFDDPRAFFAEDQGLYVVTVSDASLSAFLAAGEAADVPIQPIGRTCSGRLIFELADSDHAVSLADLRAAHEGFFPSMMDG